MKHLIVAVMIAALAVVATDARALPILTPSGPVPVGATNFISAIHGAGSPFTDTFIFLNAVPVSASGGLFTVELIAFPTSDIDFTSVTLNGHPFTLTTIPGSPFPGATTETAVSPAFNYTGNLILLVTGTTGATDTETSSYTGILNVPEPASLMLLGAGLAGIGIWSWRRKATKI